MIFYKYFAALFIVISVLMSGCATSGSFTPGLKQKSLIHIKELEATMPSEPICWIGFGLNRTSLVSYTVSEYARGAGFIEGDRLKAINNKNLSSYEEIGNILHQRRSGDLLWITVDRDGTLKDVKIVCRDGREPYFQLIEIMKLYELDKWDECISRTYDLDREWGQIPKFAGVRSDCNEAKRFQDNRLPNNKDAEIAYEYYHRRMISGDFYTKEFQDLARDDILQTIKWLEAYQFYSYANDLKKHWESAQ